MASVKKALIIDDDEVNNFIFIRQMKAADFAEKAEFVLSGQEALDTLRATNSDAENLPDVIFLDVNMPNMNAWDFLSEYESLRSTFSKPVKLFILSSSMYRKDVDKAFQHDAVVDYLYKPLTKELLSEVRTKHFS